MGFNWNLCIFVCILLVAMAAARPSTKRIDFDRADGIKLEDSAESIPNGFEYQMTIHNFARHTLCRDKTGKTAFIKVMSRKLTNLNELFVESFVIDLCRLHSRNDSILDRWVKELFDSDNDGNITEEEMRYHN